MKKTNTWYWIITGLFSAFMLFTAIPEVMMVPDAAAIVTGLGYPKYLVQFVGLAKVLGVIAILLPGLRLIKVWAYAGLFFDLLGATYSAIAMEGLSLPVSTMALPIAFLFISYFLWLKRTGQNKIVP